MKGVVAEVASNPRKFAVSSLALCRHTCGEMTGMMRQNRKVASQRERKGEERREGLECKDFKRGRRNRKIYHRGMYRTTTTATRKTEGQKDTEKGGRGLRKRIFNWHSLEQKCVNQRLKDEGGEEKETTAVSWAIVFARKRNKQHTYTAVEVINKMCWEEVAKEKKKINEQQTKTNRGTIQAMCRQRFTRAPSKGKQF